MTTTEDSGTQATTVSVNVSALAQQARVQFRGAALAVGGLAALIAGLVLRSHYEGAKRVCSSSLGALSQALDQAAQQQCNKDSDLAGLGLALIIVGVSCLGLGLLNLKEAREIKARLLTAPDDGTASAATRAPRAASSQTSTMPNATRDDRG
jgi:hypothetical protein